MVASMTGFAGKRFKLNETTFNVEIRTLNHKYLDIHCKIPESIAAMEMPLRSLVKKYIQRGRVDLRISMEQDGDAADLELNQPVYRAYCQLVDAIAEEREIQALDPVALLALPNMLKNADWNPDNIMESFLTPLKEALGQLRDDRNREGTLLWQDIRAKLASIQEFTAELVSLARQQQQEVGERFQQRLARLDEDMDDQRILTELAILVDKSDINEELVRLQAHIQEFIRTGSQQGSVGRRLEFLGQEMLRETNTIAAKSAIYPVSKYAVDIKTELEKIREQIQNIE